MAETIYIAQLPGMEITLKKVDMRDSVPGGFSSCNLNFEELQRLMNILVGAVKELADTQDINAIIESVVTQMENAKKVFPLHFGLTAQTSPEQVTFYDRVYNIERLDDRTFVVSRVLGEDEREWDTSKIIAQVKNYDGVVTNANIITREHSIIVSFYDIPDRDYFLYIV